MPSVAETHSYVIGVDTHARNHVYAIVHAQTGAQVGQPREFRATAAGYHAALVWIEEQVEGASWIAAIEGTGSYGKQLTRTFQAAGVRVVEVHPAAKTARRGRGKTDAIDAVRAAKTVTGSDSTDLAQPRRGQMRDGLQVLLTVRRIANKDRTARINALNAIVRMLGLISDTRRALTPAMIEQIAAGHVHADADPAVIASAVETAARIIALDAELKVNDRRLREITAKWMPELLTVDGVGPVSAARILCAWSHIGRFPHEGHFASMGGASPIPIGSGGSFTHRLNYGGDRQLNAALHTIMMTRARCDERTKAYIAHRVAAGTGKRAIQRLLKRYIAREIFKTCERSTTTAETTTTTQHRPTAA